MLSKSFPTWSWSWPVLATTCAVSNIHFHFLVIAAACKLVRHANILQTGELCCHSLSKLTLMTCLDFAKTTHLYSELGYITFKIKSKASHYNFRRKNAKIARVKSARRTSSYASIFQGSLASVWHILDIISPL